MTLIATHRAVAAAAACLLSVGCLSSAHAQDGEWRDPTGRFQLDLQGWTRVQPEPEYMLFAIRNDVTTDSRLRICTVRAYPKPGVDVQTQEQANEHMRGAANAISPDGGIPHSTPTVSMLGDVAVLWMTGKNNGFDVVTRGFALPERDGYSVTFVTCVVLSPLREDELLSIDTLQGSLEFLPAADSGK